MDLNALRYAKNEFLYFVMINDDPMEDETSGMEDPGGEFVNVPVSAFVGGFADVPVEMHGGHGHVAGSHVDEIHGCPTLVALAIDHALRRGPWF